MQHSGAGVRHEGTRIPTSGTTPAAIGAHTGAGISEKAAITREAPLSVERGLNRTAHVPRLDHLASAAPNVTPGQKWIPAGPTRHVHVPTTTERLRSGQLDHFVNTQMGRQMELKRQFELHQQGDVARQLRLGDRLLERGGWNHRVSGAVDPHYTHHAFGYSYAGAGFYRQRCWYPNWSPWVNWSWNFGGPFYDPRPFLCQPYSYGACGPWAGWYYPNWASLPYGGCGTWVDVPLKFVAQGLDVQLLAVRFVDSGHPERELGPRYRVWFQNNGGAPIDRPFDVLLMASNDRNPGVGLPEAGVRVTGMDAGQIQAVDVRLPYEANLLDRDAQGRSVPFRFLHVIVDARRELDDGYRANNGTVLDRLAIDPVDPMVFSAVLDEAAGTSLVDIAGEGFGPEPGQVVLRIGGQQVAPEITGWYDLGIQVRLPSGTAAEAASAEVLVIRGDNAASNPLPVRLGPQTEVVPQPVP